jgi:hypothetical protein
MNFYKSMTTHADHRVWQEAYRPSTAAGEVYLKLTVIHAARPLKQSARNTAGGHMALLILRTFLRPIQNYCI